MAKRAKKGPFDMLDKDTMSAIEGGDEAGINARICEVTKNQAALEEAQGNDQDLKDKKDAVKGAMYVYNDGKKRNKQIVAYCRFILGAKGKDTGDSGLEEGTNIEPEQTADEIVERQAQVDAKAQQ